MRSALVATFVVVALVALTISAEAGGVTMQARIFMRDTGQLDAVDHFAQGDGPRIGILDYGDDGSEMLVTVVVAPDANPAGGAVVVTVKQGKRPAVVRKWDRVHVDRAAHFPVLINVRECSPTTITAKVGRLVVKRSINFTCADD